MIYCKVEFLASTVSNSSTSEGIPIEQCTIISSDAINNTGNNNNSIISKNQKNKLIDFSRENDFQDLLPSIHELDINNPYNESLLHTLSKRINLNDKIEFYLFGNNYSVGFNNTINNNDNNKVENDTYLNYVKFKINQRLLLLKLRNMKPFLFDNKKSIPFSEISIKNDVFLKKLLYDEKNTLGIMNFYSG